eukprot:15274802-Alexandrium_andersonii.AAC.1
MVLTIQQASGITFVSPMFAGPAMVAGITGASLALWRLIRLRQGGWEEIFRGAVAHATGGVQTWSPQRGLRFRDLAAEVLYQTPPRPRRPQPA